MSLPQRVKVVNGGKLPAVAVKTREKAEPGKEGDISLSI